MRIASVTLGSDSAALFPGLVGLPATTARVSVAAAGGSSGLGVALGGAGGGDVALEAPVDVRCWSATDAPVGICSAALFSAPLCARARSLRPLPPLSKFVV